MLLVRSHPDFLIFNVNLRLCTRAVPSILHVLEGWPEGDQALDRLHPPLAAYRIPFPLFIAFSDGVSVGSSVGKRSHSICILRDVPMDGISHQQRDHRN